MFIWASQVVLGVKNLIVSAGDVRDLDLGRVGKIRWRRAWRPTPVYLPGESMDTGASRATAHSVTNSWTQLKRPSMHARINIYIYKYMHA